MEHGPDVQDWNGLGELRPWELSPPLEHVAAEVLVRKLAQDRLEDLAHTEPDPVRVAIVLFHGFDDNNPRRSQRAEGRIGLSAARVTRPRSTARWTNKIRGALRRKVGLGERSSHH